MRQPGGADRAHEGQQLEARQPPEIVTAFNTHMRKVWETPEAARRLAEVGIEREVSTPEEFGSFIREQIAFWGQQARAAGIEPE